MFETSPGVTVSTASQLIFCYYLSLASFAILYYDYALTLQAEIARFWSNKQLSWASFLFYLNRCRLVLSFHQYLAVAIQIVVGVILITRTYALYDRSKRALFILLVAAVAVISFGTWSVASGMHVDPNEEILSPMGCLLPTSKEDGIRLASAWTGLLFFDVLIISMTMYKSLKYYRSGPAPLLNVLLRDGLIYFVVMAAAGLANILTFHVSLPYRKGSITTFANIISSTMASRLMLNLRDPKLTTPQVSRRTTLRRSEPVLSTLVGEATEHTDTLNDIGILSHLTQDIELEPRTRIRM